MKLKSLMILCLAIAIMLLSLGPARPQTISQEMTKSQLSGILLQQGDLTGFNLLKSDAVPEAWPFIRSLPQYMQNPENPPEDIETLAFFESSVMVDGYKDGILQYWGSTDNKTELRIEYGYFKNPQHARNAVCYILYNRTLPTFYNYWFWSDYNMHSDYSLPSCRKIAYGDLAYFVSSQDDEVNGGGFIFMVKNNYVFMVDGLQQTSEDNAVTALLSKIK